jgi:Glycosyl hydrolases related to GH101 family, GH129
VSIRFGALRGAAWVALVGTLSCRATSPAEHTAAIGVPKAVALRRGGAGFTLDPSTLAIESRGVSLSGPMTTTASVVTELAVSPDRVAFRLDDPGLAVEASVDDEGRLTVRLTSTRARTLAWPRPSSRDVRAVALPVSEGLSISPTDGFWRDHLSAEGCLTAFGGLSMPFFGLDRDAASFAFVFPSDLGTRVCVEDVEGRITPTVRHDFTNEPYEVVFAPADGTPIGSALAYRAWLRARGAFVSLSEKTSANPAVDRLGGAIHAYLWGDGGTREAIDDLARLGVERALLAFDDDRRVVGPDVVQYAEARGYLMARYDTFDSVMAPATADSPVAVFDDELFRTGGILGANGKRLAGFAGRGLQLSSEALRRARTPFVARRIAEAKALGTNAYFVDCDAFGELFEDFDPAHPMTRARDRDNRMSRMRAVADAGFVLGSESAVAWSTSVVHFSHGNETIATDAYWRLQGDRARMGGWYPPERPKLFFQPIALTEEERREFFDPTVRVPLFQAVFHDSVVTTDRWEMSLMKVPSLVVPRTLLALLYGVPTIWSLDRTTLREHGPRLAALARFFAPFHRRIATLPLESFTYDLQDRLVQSARFGADVEVTANFDTTERAGVRGGCIEVRVRGAERATFCPEG